MKLATASELSLAEQTLQLAESKLASLNSRGIEDRRLPAGAAGLVAKIDVQEGQIVPAGGPLAEVVPARRIEARLGVEPAQQEQVAPGQVVHIERVHDGQAPPVEAVLKMVTGRVNPASRLVDVYASLPEKSGLELDSFVVARIVVGSRRGLLAPRSAVTSEEDKQIVYTVSDGKAVRHEVHVELDDGRDVLLAPGDVKPGDRVVVLGNAELEDGMAVATEAAGPATAAEGRH